MFKLGLKIVGVIAAIMLLLFVISMVSGIFSIAKTPMQVMKKTFNADKMIHDYEWFHDVEKAHGARVAQIKQFKSFLSNEEDAQEKRNLRMEMAAQQQSCRRLVAKYNANSLKMNVGIFKGWSLPDKLNPLTCE